MVAVLAAVVVSESTVDVDRQALELTFRIEVEVLSELGNAVLVG